MRIRSKLNATGVAAGMLVAATGIAIPAQAGPTVSVYTVPSTIDGTGTVDTTADLLAFFATVPDGRAGSPNVIIPPSPGLRYRIDGTLALQLRNHLVFDGNGATFDGGHVMYPPPGSPVPAVARTRAQWRFQRGSDITVRNMAINGANPNGGITERAYRADLEAQHGLDILGVDGVDIGGVTVTDTYGDFVYLGLALTTPPVLTRNVHVHDSRFERNGRQGLSFTGAVDVLIERNYISQVRRTIFDFEPNNAAGEIRRVTIRDNDVGARRLGTFAANGNPDAPMGDVVVDGNRLFGAPLQGGINAPGVRRGPFTFTNNTSARAYGSPAASMLNFFRIDGVTVTGNTVKLEVRTPTMNFVRTREACTVDVSGNAVTGGPEWTTDGYSCA